MPDQAEHLSPVTRIHVAFTVGGDNIETACLKNILLVPRVVHEDAYELRLPDQEIHHSIHRP